MRIRRVLVTGVWLFALLSSAWICHSCYLVTALGSPRSSTRVIMPTGYEGPVLIIWSVPGGQTAELKDDNRLLYYRLQDDGALLIADDPPGPYLYGLPFFYLRGTLTFWHDLPGPHMQYVSSICPDETSDQGVGLCSGRKGGAILISNGIERRQRPFASYVVTNYENKGTAVMARARLEEEYRHEMFFPPENSSP